MAKHSKSVLLINFFLIFGFAYSQEIMEEPKESEPIPPVEVPIEIGDRINLDYNRAYALARNPYGPSGSYANQYDLQAGIGNIYYPGQFKPIYHRSGSYGTSFAQPGAPYTDAYAGRGGAGSHFYGGQGIADAYSRHRQYAYPIDHYGNVLLSNLKVKNNNEHEPIQEVEEKAPGNKANELQFPEDGKIVNLAPLENTDSVYQKDGVKLIKDDEKAGRKIIDKNREIDDEIPTVENKFDT